MAKTLPADIHTATVLSSPTDERVRLSIRDSASGLTVCEIAFNAEQFGKLLTGGQLSEHPVIWHRPDRLGWSREAIERIVVVENGDDHEHNRAKEAVMEAAVALSEENPGAEVTARESDAWNPHRAGKRGRRYTEYNVVFWITRPPEGE